MIPTSSRRAGCGTKQSDLPSWPARVWSTTGQTTTSCIAFISPSLPPSPSTAAVLFHTAPCRFPVLVGRTNIVGSSGPTRRGLKMSMATTFCTLFNLSFVVLLLLHLPCCCWPPKPFGRPPFVPHHGSSVVVGLRCGPQTSNRTGMHVVHLRFSSSFVPFVSCCTPVPLLPFVRPVLCVVVGVPRASAIFPQQPRQRSAQSGRTTAEFTSESAEHLVLPRQNYCSGLC